MINKVEKFDYKTAGTHGTERQKKTANIHKINYEKKSIPNFVYFYKNDFIHTYLAVAMGPISPNTHIYSSRHVDRATCGGRRMKESNPRANIQTHFPKAIRNTENRKHILSSCRTLSTRVWESMNALSIEFVHILLYRQIQIHWKMPSRYTTTTTTTTRRVQKIPYIPARYIIYIYFFCVLSIFHFLLLLYFSAFCGILCFSSILCVWYSFFALCLHFVDDVALFPQ